MIHQPAAKKSRVQLPKTETISSLADVLLVRFFWWGQSFNQTNVDVSLSPNQRIAELSQTNIRDMPGERWTPQKYFAFKTSVSQPNKRNNCSSFRGSFLEKKTTNLNSQGPRKTPIFLGQNISKTHKTFTQRPRLKLRLFSKKDIKVPGYVPLIYIYIYIYDP